MFNCTKCGACCRLVPDRVLKAVGLPRANKGGCANLNDDNTCKIYNTRPLVCNVDGMYEALYSKKGMSKEEFYKLSEEECKKLEKQLSEKTDI